MAILDDAFLLRFAGRVVNVHPSLLPAYGGTQFLPALVGRARALDMMVTGRALDVREAFANGLVDRVVPADQVLEESVAYAAQFSGAAALAIVRRDRADVPGRRGARRRLGHRPRIS